MRLSFIGMSNIGKTAWAKRIAASVGCGHVDCDALIEDKLRGELRGKSGLDGVAAWMGFPSDPHYAENGARYVAAERAVMQEALARLKNADNIILDTTGSVIYTGDDIMKDMRMLTRVAYFEASKNHIDRLFHAYISHPKPVIWGEIYAPREGETAAQTLERCYTALLRERAKRYKEIAHVTIPFETHRDRKADILSLIKAAS